MALYCPFEDVDLCTAKAMNYANIQDA